MCVFNLGGCWGLVRSKNDINFYTHTHAHTNPGSPPPLPSFTTEVFFLFSKFQIWLLFTFKVY